MNFKGTVGFGGTSARLILRPATALVLVATLLTAYLPKEASASGGGVALPKQNWSFKGIFGQFDASAIKRGAQVAVGVCLACHSMKYIKFDQLRQFGFTEAEIIELAQSQGRNKKDTMMASMDATSAKEAFGVEPPDLSLMTKARKGYEDYSYAILTGYASNAEMGLAAQVMADGKISETESLEVASKLHLDAHNLKGMEEILTRISGGENFNKYFPGNFFAMPNPLMDGAITYSDGTESTVKQMSSDVVTFMAWAAEPTLMERKALGIKVILYLFVLTIMLYAVKRRIWAKVH